MSGANGGSVKVELAGAILRVDARPARLVSLLRSPTGDPIFTTQAQDGASHTEAVPAEARQVAFLVDGELAVEASRASDFVALSEPSGRQVVVSFTGEVTVLPAGGGGDRFALGAHEALLVPGDGGDPRVVPGDSLSEADQDEISAAMEAAALAVAMPSADAPADPPTETPAEAAPAVAPSVVAPSVPAPAPASAPAKGAGPAKKGPPTTPRGASAAKRNKKGKRGRPQAQRPAKKAPVAAVAATTSAGAAAGEAAATPKESKAAKATPVRKRSGSAARAAQPPGKGGTGPGGGPDGGPSDRRFIIGAVALAVVIAIALGAFALTSGSSDEGNETAGDTTTTAMVEATTTTAPTTTSAAPVAAPTTTVIASTTTAAPATTTAPAAPVKYAIEPKSCLQNPDNSITYVATIKNESTVAFAYTIRVVFKDGAASVATDDAQVARLEAGRSVDFTARGTPKQSLLTGGSCTVERVDARPSES